MKKLIVLISRLFGTALPSHSETVSALVLKQACEARNDDIFMGAFCIGYINSAYENMIWGSALTLRTLSEVENSADEINGYVETILGFCTREAESVEEVVEKVSAFLVALPNLEELSARGAVYKALQFSFPCQY